MWCLCVKFTVCNSGTMSCEVHKIAHVLCVQDDAVQEWGYVEMYWVNHSEIWQGEGQTNNEELS